jgi:hypothetical protein
MKSLILIGMVCGLVYAGNSRAEPDADAAGPGNKEPAKKVIYPENQTIDFEGLSLEGELKTPGEFYFQNRNQERFDSLTKRRVNFRREMLRDSVQSN